MVQVDYIDLDAAVSEVSEYDLGPVTGWVNKVTGQIYVRNYELEGYASFDDPDDEHQARETNPLNPEPADLGSEDWVRIPNDCDLDLSHALVRRFVDDVVPGHRDAIDELWHRRGAWRRYKGYLDRIGMLDAWHDYQLGATVVALTEWAASYGLELVGVPASALAAAATFAAPSPRGAVASQIAHAMADEGLDAEGLALWMAASPDVVARLLDPLNDTVTLDELASAAKALGRRLTVSLD